VPSAVADGLAPQRELPVTVSSGTLPDGRRAWFAFNWSWTDTVVRIARDVVDPTGDSRQAAGTELPIPAWSTLTLLDGCEDLGVPPRAPRRRKRRSGETHQERHWRWASAPSPQHCTSPDAPRAPAA